MDTGIANKLQFRAASAVLYPYAYTEMVVQHKTVNCRNASLCSAMARICFDKAILRALVRRTDIFCDSTYQVVRVTCLL